MSEPKNTRKLLPSALLATATLIALAWASSPWAAHYDAWLHTPLAITIGGIGLHKPLLLWINDGLMGIFFFHVGLEIKREVTTGELASPRRLALPLGAAVGGMVLPALFYFAFNHGQPTAIGWGVPMATDIAFALGVLGLLGSRVPLGLRVFLSALAIVDDIGAVLVIALFYTESVAALTLIAGLALLGIGVLLNRRGVRNPIVYFLLGTLVWLAFLKSGVHATIAALLMAFTIPARMKINGKELLGRIDDHALALKKLGLPDGSHAASAEQQHALDDLAVTLKDGGSPLLKLEHALTPVVGLLVVPLFALANAGVRLEGDVGPVIESPIALGVMAGLLLGKPLGVIGGAWLLVKLGWASLPVGVSARQIVGAGFLAGIGFTMSLFVAGLAFEDPVHLTTAKLAILVSSTVAGLIGYVILRRAPAA